MVKYENDCVGCPKEMGCMGSACPYVDVPHYYCDDCKEEAEEMYRFLRPWADDCDYCYDCLINNINTDMIDSFYEEDNFYEDEAAKYFYCIYINPKYADKILSDEEVSNILSAISDEDYKDIRKEYFKSGDAKLGFKYIKYELGMEYELFELICEEITNSHF